MDFIDRLKQFSKRVESMRDSLQTEEATKTAIIMPFFAMLGYDVFNPQEFVPEFTADVGIKKGEKVDYAIINNGKPAILIECKSINENLDRHDSQLFRYFGTTTAKFAILTNGIFYKFYTDLDDPNKMDKDPFLTINILDIRDNQVPELKKFCKSVFDVDAISSTASELKYAHEFKSLFTKQLDSPSDDFIRFFLQNCYSGAKTQNVLEKFRPILKKALNDLVSEMMNDKIKIALGSGGNVVAPEQMQPDEQPDNLSNPAKKEPRIVTTEEELEAFFIIKNLLADVTDIHDITYKDTESYINILYKGNTRKWICRLRLTDNQKTLIVPDENKNESKYKLVDIYDLREYKGQLTTVLERYL
ncbi:type I restriction endonuclease [Pseudoflavonifractor sp. An85]|uniref:type I restriction endonuclease n=1 Tax=Pseudoflavonifractor sp. An85 TaxID=1965661 RepID=UPI000B3A932F|nr:type I restriction endonuclease [Pseudoflavonifractor sp. An85]OUN20846.1 endonuclease [Pseudoflavonifractor sp. An85]